MFKVIIHKDRFTYNVFNDTKNDWEQIVINEDTGPISKYFNEEVEIHEDVTFEDLMNLMERYEGDINFCFAAYSKCIPLKIYLKEMRTDITHEVEIVGLELFRKGEIVSHELSTHNSINGFMSEKSAEELGETIDKPLSVDTYHVNALKRALVTLNENLVFVDYGNPSDDMSETESIVFSGFCKWTLHDVFSTFLSVLTNNGTPEERDVINEYEPYSFERVSKNKDEIEMWIELFREELVEKRQQKAEAISEERYEDALIVSASMLELEEKIKDLQEQNQKTNNDQQMA